MAVSNRPRASSRRRFAAHWSVFAAAAVVAIAAVAFDCIRERGRIEVRERARLLAQSRVIAINLEHQLAATMAALRATMEDIARWRVAGAYLPEANRRLAAFVSSTPGVTGAVVADIDGTIRAASSEDLIGVDLGGRAWFGLRRGAKTEAAHSPPDLTNPVSEPLILSDTLLTGTGRKIGLGAVLIDRHYFDTILRSALYSPDGRILLVHADGIVIAAAPAQPDVEERNLRADRSPLESHLSDGARETVIVGTSPSAREQRLAALVTVSSGEPVLNRSIIVCASREFGPIFSEWRADSIGKAGLIAALLLIIAAVLRAYHVRENRYVGEAEAAERTIRLWAGAFEHGAQGIAISDVSSGRVTACNSALARLLRRPVADIVGTSILTAFEPPARQSARGHLDHPDHAGCINFFSRMQRSDGSTVPVEIHVSTGVDDFGRAAHHIVNVIDRTERNAIDAAMCVLSNGVSHSAGQEFFNEMARQIGAILGGYIGFVGRRRWNAETVVDCVGFRSGDGKIEEVRFRLAGQSCRRLLESDVAIFPGHGSQILDADPASLKAEDVTVAAAPLIDSKGRAIGVLGVLAGRVLRDGEQIKNTLRLFALRAASEMERQNNEQKFNHLFEFSPGGMLLIDEGSRIVHANRCAVELFGYTRDELGKLNASQIIRDAAGSECDRFDLASAATSVVRMGAGDAPFIARRKDGTEIAIDVAVGFIEGNDGKSERIVEVCDVTARIESEKKNRALESQLRHAQKMEAVGRLSGGIAHDFNNLLQVISSNVDLARAESDAGRPVHRNLQRIGKASDRAAELTARLLAFSRRQPLVPRALNLNEIIAGLVPMLDRVLPATITVDVARDRSMPVVCADPGELESAVLNLAINARDAMPDGGKIRIEVNTTVVVDGVDASSANLAPGAYGVVAVSDTGHGMTPEIRERVFEPFFTTKDIGRGTGLGLSMVYGFAKQSGGDVAIASEPDHGTTVSIFLPVSEKRADVATPVVQTVVKPHKSATVLVVEDDPMVRSLAVESIAGLGYQVVEAKDGFDALYQMAIRPEIDLLFTDIVMPGGLNGKELARNARAIKSALKVVYTTGYADGIGEEEAEGPILPKPYRREQLAATLQSTLDA